MSEIDPGVVRYVADLARISLTDDEVKRFTVQLSVVLDSVGKLREVDTEDIPPTASVLPLANVTREDEVRPSLSLEDAMRNAPTRDGDLFRVQTVIEERPEERARG